MRNKLTLWLSIIVLLISVEGCSYASDSETTMESLSPIDSNEIMYADFSDYSELECNFLDSLQRIEKELQKEKTDTTSFQEYMESVKKYKKIRIPKVNGENIELNHEDGYYSIYFQSRDLYEKPWLFFSLKDNECNSYVKIADFSIELSDRYPVDIISFLNEIDPTPNNNLFYPAYNSVREETVEIAGESVNVMFSTFENDPRCYVTFLCDYSLVVICCSQEKLDQGLLQSFSLEDLELR